MLKVVRAAAHPTKKKRRERRFFFADCGLVDEHFFSGSELQKALGAVTTGGVLVVENLSCLGPRTHDVAYVVRALQRVGGHIRILRDEIDTSAPGGHALFRLMLAFDELERRAASRAAKLRIERARRSGTRYGSPRALKPEKEDYARREVKRGRRVEDVAAELGVTPITIYRTLKRDPARPGKSRTKPSKAKARNNLTTAPALTAAQEEFVRKEAARGRKAREIADELGVDIRAIRRLLKRGE